MRVTVQVDVEVDPQVWADTYGFVNANTGPDGATLRDDFETHTKAIVMDAATEAMNRIGVGARVW